jgi:hypothetical protein
MSEDFIAKMRSALDELILVDHIDDPHCRICRATGFLRAALRAAS